MTLDDLLSKDLPVDVLRRGVEVLLDEARREGEMTTAEALMDLSAVERAEIEARAKVDLLRDQREERLRWRERGTPPVDPVAAAAFLRVLLNTNGGDDE